jgi:23S rRNA (guanosine2251-2'-O)-methyltransferase
MTGKKARCGEKSPERKYMNQEYLYGINTILALLNVNAGKRKIFALNINGSKNRSPRIDEIVSRVASKGTPVNVLEHGDFIKYLSSAFSGPKAEDSGLKTGREIPGKASGQQTGTGRQLPGKPSSHGSSKYGSYASRQPNAAKPGADFSRRTPGEYLSEEFLSSTQGIVAEVSNYSYSDLDTDLKELSNKKSLLLLLDEITDVGNFGSILRNCSAFGADGVIITKNRSVEANSRVSKISSGAMEEVKIYNVTNLSKTMELLKENGFWIYGTSSADVKNIMSASDTEYVFPAAVVFGSEGKGMGKLVESKCDFLVTIEMFGHMQSLNVSTSSGIMLFLMKQYQKNLLKQE